MPSAGRSSERPHDSELKSIRIIGIPMDLGQSRRGVDMGPSALRVAGILQKTTQLGYKVEDIGNLQVKQPEEQPFGERQAKFLGEIAATCKGLANTVAATLKAGKFPLVLGGDHSIAIGSVGGVAAHYRSQKKKIGVIWLDAHGDMNTPGTSPSGNVHGMPLASLTGFGADELTGLTGASPAVDPGNVSLVGIRSLDARERKLIRKAGVNVFTMRDIDERGMRAVMRDAIQFATDGTTGFAVSLDMDFLDPDYAPGVGTPVKGGVTYREAHLAMEILADSGGMLSLEVVEINPVIDEHNKTAQLAVELVLSGLGKKIL